MSLRENKHILTKRIKKQKNHFGDNCQKRADRGMPMECHYRQNSAIVIFVNGASVFVYDTSIVKMVPQAVAPPPPKHGQLIFFGQ